MDKHKYKYTTTAMMEAILAKHHQHLKIQAYVTRAIIVAGLILAVLIAMAIAATAGDYVESLKQVPLDIPVDLWFGELSE